MIIKQPMSLTFYSSRQWNRSIKVLIVTLITQNTKFILAFKFLVEFFLGLSAFKECVFSFRLFK